MKIEKYIYLQQISIIGLMSAADLFIYIFIHFFRQYFFNIEIFFFFLKMRAKLQRTGKKAVFEDSELCFQC